MLKNDQRIVFKEIGSRKQGFAPLYQQTCYAFDNHTVGMRGAVHGVVRSGAVEHRGPVDRFQFYYASCKFGALHSLLKQVSCAR